ncbi:TPA: hypothetical protein ACIECO_002291 [Enterococcus faecium]|nr:hypothetical protein [Enterococcus faecium]
MVEKVGKKIKLFKKGDKVYSRLPLDKIGAFAEYVAVNQNTGFYLKTLILLQDLQYH